MSEETPQIPEENGALDLSGLNFGPAWARDSSESKSLKKFKGRGNHDGQRGGGRRGEGGDQGGFQRGSGGRGARNGRGGGRRRDEQSKPRRQEVAPPAGVSMRIMPAEESLDLLAKRVVDSGQTFSVFDLAKVLLQSRDRFRVTFDSSEKDFYRCREDQSVWLTRDEALRHIWRADWLGKYYEEVKVENEAPKGSFSAVARCGLSHEFLGPPNYHGYQEKLNALHRERFSSMPLDAYRAKVQTEHGEEAVEAWLESMKTVSKWKLAEQRDEGVEEKGEVVTEASSTGEGKVEGEKTTSGDEGAVEVQIHGDGEETGVDQSPAVELGAEQVLSHEVELFDDARAVERHFSEHYFGQVFEETKRAWVLGDIRGNLLSPGLLTLLKNGIAEEKRYPSQLMPLVCRQLSGRHVAVFKWKKKLKVGPSRPHAVPTDTALSARPQAMIDQVTKRSGITLKEFWQEVMPDDVTDEQKHEWLQDFQWLLGQGHLILLSDTSVHLAKSHEVTPQQRKADVDEKNSELSKEEVAPAVEVLKEDSLEEKESKLDVAEAAEATGESHTD